MWASGSVVAAMSARCHPSMRSSSSQRLQRKQFREFFYAIFNRRDRRDANSDTLAKASKNASGNLLVMKLHYRRLLTSSYFWPGRLINIFIFKHFQCSIRVGWLGNANLRKGCCNDVGVFPSILVMKFITRPMLSCQNAERRA